MAILNVNDLKKTYTGRFGAHQVGALKGVTFSVEDGEYVAIMGESGSGKTTLLNILAVLDRPTSGSVLLNGKDISTVKDDELAVFRRENLGFIFQEFNLLDTFSVKDNILLPLVLSGKSISEMKERLNSVAGALGISDILNKFSYEISGGQKQRAAAARALITNPKLVLADEPTGAHDSQSSAEQLRIFHKINENIQTIFDGYTLPVQTGGRPAGDSDSSRKLRRYRKHICS